MSKIVSPKKKTAPIAIFEDFFQLCHEKWSNLSNLSNFFMFAFSISMQQAYNVVTCLLNIQIKCNSLIWVLLLLLEWMSKGSMTHWLVINISVMLCYVIHGSIALLPDYRTCFNFTMINGLCMCGFCITLCRIRRLLSTQLTSTGHIDRWPLNYPTTPKRCNFAASSSE